ncbi:MAG: type II secretion system F family protein, partial [Planctomyces sp.]
MPELAWKARTMSGQNVSGVMTADSRRDVLALLSQRALSPLSVTPSKAPFMSLKLQRGVKPDVLAATLTQLADLLTNGVPL